MNATDIKRVRKELGNRNMCVITNEDRTYHDIADVFIWDDANEQLIIVRTGDSRDKSGNVQIFYVPYEDFVTMYTVCRPEDIKDILSSKSSAITSSGWTMEKIVDKFTSKWEKQNVPPRI